MKQKIFYSESSVKNGWVRSCINMSMCSGVCMGVRGVYLSHNLEFVFEQMMEMYYKAVHAFGACATIKSERWVYGSEIF